MTQSIGKVYLIGAGPGDPGLITVKGLECVKKADVIIYDYLANERLLEHRRPEAELVYVGKQGGRHTLPQNEINALIIQ
ncbi:MAG TPA: SAM-dependent methyltransferase, partial [Nitrospirota bacterium]|nr:SAM-dependent methyltransferase [Nitrospirota bacterium]